MLGCVICETGGDGLVEVTERGKKSLIEFSKLRNNDGVLDRLVSGSQIHVHETCRKWYNNRKRISAESRQEQEKDKVPRVETRSSPSSKFTWTSDCFFCSSNIMERTQTWHHVQTHEIRDTILQICSERLKDDTNDDLALRIKSRLETAIDLVACGARYHQNCKTNFLNRRTKSVGDIHAHDSIRCSVGRSIGPIYFELDFSSFFRRI